jgi:tetratricopeptide (TPR) repeat protein
MTFCLGAFMRGNFDGILEVISNNARQRAAQPINRAIEAWALAVMGRHDEARALLADFDDGGAYGIHLVAVWTILAEAAARCGDVDTSRTLIDLLAPCRDQFASTISNPIYAVAHATGVAKACVGELDEAVADLQHALALHEKMRSPFHIAYTQTALADALARRGTRDDLDRARTLARGALDVANDRGYGYIVRDAGAVLERLT